MLRFCFALCLGLMPAALTRAGSVATLDGRTIEGDVHLTNGWIVVATEGGTNMQVAITNLAQARFSQEDDVAGVSKGRGNGLLGYYFGNTNLDGAAFVRLDETVDFDWSIGEPAPGVAIDYFGVVWCGEVEAPVTGDYSFAVAADEFCELYLNNQSIINTRHRRDAAEAFSIPTRLQAGTRYPFRLAYYDLTGTARVKLMWSGPGIPKGVVPRSRLYARGFQSVHSADVTASRGLLGTYYKSRDFSGPTMARVDPTLNFNWTEREPLPGFNRTNLSVRWTGQVQAEHSEEYTFHVVTDDRMRLWIDGKPVINRVDEFWLSEVTGSLPLVARERHDIRLEVQNTSGDAVAKLLWSSASTPKTNIPPSHLFPSKPPAASLLSVNGGDRLPPGVLLRNGSFIACNVEQATESSLRASGRLNDRPVSTVNVARILCQPLSRTMESRVSPGRVGALLANGDFVEGDFRGMDNGQVRLSSVLFGPRSFDARKEVIAVVLRDVARAAGVFELQLRDSSRILGKPGVETDRIAMQDSILGVLRFTAGEALFLRHFTSGGSAAR